MYSTSIDFNVFEEKLLGLVNLIHVTIDIYVGRSVSRLSVGLPYLAQLISRESLQRRSKSKSHLFSYVVEGI